MKQEQTWNWCKLSGRDECIHKDKEAIRRIASTEARVSPPGGLMLTDPDPITSSMISEANEICSNCEAFELWPPQTYDKCKHFSYQKCPHINDDIMKRKSARLQETFGGSYIEISFPTDEETNRICKKCDTFTTF
jgi:hypothetical protein